MTDTPQGNQPRNTAFIPLAGEIPQYRQAKLAGKKYGGPIRNVVSRFNALNTTRVPILSDESTQPIKGQNTITRSSTAETEQPVPQEGVPQVPSQTSTPVAAPPNIQTTLNAQNSQLTQKLKEKEKELAQLRARSAEQQKHLQGLTTQRKTAESVIQNLKQQLTNLEQHNIDPNELKAMRDRIDQKEKETVALTEEAANLKKTLLKEGKLEQQIVNYRNQIRALTDQQKKLQDLVSQSEQKLQSLNSQLVEEKREKISKDSQIKKLERLLDDTIKGSLSPPKTTQKVVTAEEKSSGTLPVMTKTPNSINGVVVDKGGKFISDTVVLIKNIAGQNLRALRTNQLGQFIVTTPLPNGKYFVEASKSAFTFDVTEINLVGGVLPPIEIRSYELTP